MAKIKTTVGFTPDAKNLVQRLSQKLGVDQTSVLELAIRALAKQYEIQPEAANG